MSEFQYQLEEEVPQDWKTKIVNLFVDMGFVSSPEQAPHLQLSSGLLLFYIAVSGNFLGELFSRSMQEFFTNNRWAKHMIGFITMLFSITYATGITKLTPALIMTFILYFWFLLTTKMSPAWNFGIIIVLLFSFILEKYKNNLNPQKPDDRQTISFLVKMSNALFVLVLLVTLIGAGMYLFTKKQKFGGDFSVTKFIFAPSGGQMVPKAAK